MSARATPERVLRIGVIQGGRIVEERIVPARRTVTIGHGSRCTLVFHSVGLPACLPLFIACGGKYLLAFSEEMEGRVSTAEGVVIDLEALRGRSQRQRDGAYHFPLDLYMRGKITVGQTTVLFQFVTQPTAARDRSRGLSRSWLRQLDPTFCRILVLSAVLHGATLLHALGQPRAAPVVSYELIPDRIARLPRPQPGEPPLAPIAPVGHPPRKSVVRESSARLDPRRQPEEQMPLESRERRTADHDIIQVLTSKLGSPNTPVETLDLPETGWLIGSRDPVRRRPQVLMAEGPVLKGGTDAETVLVERMPTVGRDVTVPVAHGPRRAPPPVLAPPEVVGRRDQDALSRVLKGYMGAVTSCYEQALKLNPALHGKFYLDFTVEGSGRVSHIDVRAQKGETDPVLRECLELRIRTWVFSPSEDGAADVSLPVVFTATESL